jgi:hypothetical protein
MKKVILIFVFLFPLFCFGQIKNSSVNCKFLNRDEIDLLDSFNISYCSPWYRKGILDSIPYFTKNDFFVSMFNKHKEKNSEDDFYLYPQTNRIIMTGFEFNRQMDYFDEYSKNINDEIFEYEYFDIIGMKEFPITEKSKSIKVTNLTGDGYYTINSNNFISVLIVEKYYPRVNQITPRIYLRHKNGKFIDPGMNMSNVIKMGL